MLVEYLHYVACFIKTGTADKDSIFKKFKVFLFEPSGFNLTPSAHITCEPLILTGFTMGPKNTFHHVIQDVIDALYISCGFDSPQHFTIDPVSP